MELRLILALLFLLPTLCFANADNFYYKDAIVVANLVPDEDSAILNEDGTKTYQTLKLDLPFVTYHEEILTPIDLKDISNAGKSVVANIHYSAFDIGAEKRVADESNKVAEFIGTVATEAKAVEAKTDAVKMETAISESKVSAEVKAEMIGKIEAAKPKIIAEEVEVIK